MYISTSAIIIIIMAIISEDVRVFILAGAILFAFGWVAYYAFLGLLMGLALIGVI